MTKEDARNAVLAASQKAFADYDAIHGGLRGMKKSQMYAYIEKRTEYVNSVIGQMLPQEVMALAV